MLDRTKYSNLIASGNAVNSISRRAENNPYRRCRIRRPAFINRIDNLELIPALVNRGLVNWDLRDLRATSTSWREHVGESSTVPPVKPPPVPLYLLR